MRWRRTRVRDASSSEGSYHLEKQWLRMFDLLESHHFWCIDAMECRDRVFPWFDRFEASFGATIAKCTFRRTHSKCPLLFSLVNIDIIKGVKDRYMLLRSDTSSFILSWFVWVRFECVLKRLDEFQRLIIVGTQVKIRAVLDQTEAFRYVRIAV